MKLNADEIGRKAQILAGANIHIMGGGHIVNRRTSTARRKSMSGIIVIKHRWDDTNEKKWHEVLTQKKSYYQTLKQSR
jgi:D-tyrosyl-tRNA(Tyr) deacylase